MTAKRKGRPYILQEQIGFALRSAYQHHTAIFTTLMVGDLTQPQFAALSTLRVVGRCSQNNLGRMTALDSATIKGVVARLQQRDLLRAAADATDKRRLVLTVTPTGAALLDRAELAAAAITDTTLAHLAPSEQKQLLHLLAKITKLATEAGQKIPLQRPTPNKALARLSVRAKRPAVAEAIASPRKSGG